MLPPPPISTLFPYTTLFRSLNLITGEPEPGTEEVEGQQGGDQQCSKWMTDEGEPVYNIVVLRKPNFRDRVEQDQKQRYDDDQQRDAEPGFPALPSGFGLGHIGNPRERYVDMCPRTVDCPLADPPRNRCR